MTLFRGAVTPLNGGTENGTRPAWFAGRVAALRAVSAEPRAAGRAGKQVGYMLAVAASHRVTLGIGVSRADQVAATLSEQASQRLSGGAGAKGFLDHPPTGTS